MSLSPRDASDPEQVFRYRRAWSAINLLLERGRSLSGRERNCAFLNTGEDRWADVSAASGLDLLDDGRGVALCDWDFDGRIDLWTSNRTGPSVRLMHNRSRTPGNFLSVKLTGRTCNRDAIGARLELHLAGDLSRVLHRTVRAGEGFASQSSKWIHFGLGADREIEKLVVRWPGGDRQEFRGLAPRSCYRLVQGDAKPQEWAPPKIEPWPQPEPLPKESSKSRTILATRLPLPDAEFQRGEKESSSLLADLKKPRLLALWAPWCTPCLTEMGAWSQGWQGDREAFEVLAIEATEGTDPPSDTKDAPRWPAFSQGEATPQVLEVLEAALTALPDKPQSLALPLSVLLDGKGRVAAIYRGPVSLETLREDVAQIDGDPAALRARASHFPGQWFESPPSGDPSVLVKNFLLAGRTAAAERYLERWQKDPTAAGSPLLESYYLVADSHRADGNFSRAIDVFRQALTFDANHPRVHHDLAMTLVRTEQFAEAVPHFQSALKGNPRDLDARKRLIQTLVRTDNFAEIERQSKLLLEQTPKDPVARMHLAYAEKKQRRFAEAVVSYRAALALSPDLILAVNDLAWILATCPDDSVRNGAESLKLAEQACRATRFQHPAVLDTLAAAQAESGKFEQALETISTAIRLATAAGDRKLAGILAEREKLYREKRPLRE